MKLPVPFIQLPLTFDAARLAAEIAAVDPGAWRPHPQGYEGNDALALIAVGGDPGDDAVRGPMRPTPHLLRMPYLRQVLASLESVLGRTRLMRLSGHAEVTPHVDVNYYWRDRVRVHVPIVTQPTVRFACGDAEVNMAAGECWIFDTWRLHRVVNDAVESRVHLVADTVGSSMFWDLVGAGRPFGRDTTGWRPRGIGFDPAREPVLLFESHNLPKVMSPWELRDQLAFLIGETEPSPRLDAFARAANAFLAQWRALWAAHGEDDAGRPAYAEALGRLRGALELLRAPPVLMRNGQPLARSVQSLMIQPALAGAAQGDPEVRSAAGTPRRR